MEAIDALSEVTVPAHTLNHSEIRLMALIP